MRALGICWIVYGMIRVCIGVGLVVFMPTATVMFGALLGRVPNPYWLMDLFHFMYALAIVVSIVCGLLGIAGGLANLGNAKAGRGLLIVASFLALPEMPLGIMLGVYTLIVLLTGSRVERV
jgi:hypothetical protein